MHTNAARYAIKLCRNIILTNCGSKSKWRRANSIAESRKQNGSLLYTLLPIQFSIQQFYEQKLAKLDAECEQERIRKRLEAFQQAQ